jgi:ABC-type glycerol-3-phosphate transport system substrate-binding protein
MKQSLASSARPLSRRRFLQSSALAAGALGAAGALPRSALAQTGQLRLWTPGGSPVMCQFLTELLAIFAERQGGLDVSGFQCGVGEGFEFSQVLVAAIAARNPPDTTMLWDSPVSLGLQGAFLALDEMMAGSRIPAETWHPGLLATTQFRGQTFGLPVVGGIFSMWYNEELFEAKGISSARADFPKTWDEMRRLSKEFTVWNGDRLEVAGFMPPREPETMEIWSALNGGLIYDGDTLRYTIDSDGNIEMFQFFLDWLDEEYKGDINLIDRSGNFIHAYVSGTTGLGPAFREGRMAGFQSGSWVMGDFWTDPEPTFTRWNLAPHPVGPSGTASVSGTWPNWFVIPVTAQNPEIAFAFLEFLSLEGVVEWYRQIPDPPGNIQVELPLPTIVVERRGEAFARDVTDFLQAQAAIVTPMWNSPVQSFARDQIARALERIYTKESPIAEALADAQTASQAELERVLAG